MSSNGYIDGVSIASAVNDLLQKHSWEKNSLINRLRNSGIEHHNECHKGDLWIYGYDIYSPEFVDSDENGEYVTLWGTFRQRHLDLLKSSLILSSTLVYRGSDGLLFKVEGK